MNHGGPTVHLMCGFNGAGKTTYAKQVETGMGAMRFSLDEWMIRLHPGLPYQSELYGPRAEVCKLVIWDIAVQFLDRGGDVILDWNPWNRGRRSVWRKAAQSAGFPVHLHFPDVGIETALQRSARRTACRTPGAHRLEDSDIRHLATIFEAPSVDEGIPVTTVRS